MYKTGLEPPKGVWWKPVERWEKVWVAIAFGWCMVLFAMMPLWHLKGGQNPTGVRHTVTADDFRERVQEFIDEYQVGMDSGFPVVAPPPGSDIYLLGRMWAWTPVLQLEKGATYMLHFSSTDVNHGFNLHPLNINFQVVPGYDYALEIVPTEAGDFRIVCNEFCGFGHHLMVGRIVVVDPDDPGAVAWDGGQEASPTSFEARRVPATGDGR